ncbi:flagellar FliL protein [Noviherbaspirillum humi]|uniref:Flagellar protein FliL n=1 Tax=Noviherbaspirillum humi TaxID=1688639 RepID=A0A239FY50_9BURK|nr:flagellar basal body-associated protein FliL [Noviherbaspirillum humi]SNS61398.1 flagellar FliL protein [Noviherbaspirillum humi]
MATAAKSKAAPAEETGGKAGSKKLIIIIAALAVLLAAGGGAAWFFLGHKKEEAHGDAHADAPKAKVDPGKPPVFVTLEQFTVNLQPDNGNEQFLQLSMTLQVPDQPTVDQIKTFMPLVRSRLLMLLSSKKASDLLSIEGKNKLIEEVITQFKQPFAKGGSATEVSGVFFTSFVIQ